MIPAVGLFRIDLTTASFTFLDRQVWWSNFSLTFGMALTVATLPIITYMTIGTVWCGWACPQNTLSEWANNLTHKLLGKRANVEIDSKGLQVAATKNKGINWILLALSFFGASLVLGVIPFLYFYSVAEVWSFISHNATDKLSTFMQRLYWVVVFLIFIDIAVVRHFFCNYVCLYRIGQKIFKTQNALHIAYDSSRTADCAKCNYCATSCITRINPTDIKTFDSCINCGECIDACNRLHEKSGTPGLISFELGDKMGRNTTLRKKISDVLARFNWLVGTIFLLGCAMMVWGIVTAQQVKPQISLAEQQKARQIAEICDLQCMTQQISCKAGTIASCYRKAACQCQCYLQQNPSNPSSSEWLQCVKKNTENAEAPISNGQITGVKKAQPRATVEQHP